MAIVQQDKVVKPYNNKLPFPLDRYLCQCIEEKFAPSQKGNPMITREWQVVAPETVEINGCSQTKPMSLKADGFFSFKYS